MEIKKLKNKKILILGFGREGKSVLKFLRKSCPDNKITVWDQANEKNFSADYLKVLKSDPTIKYQLGIGDWKKILGWEKYDLIIKSAGIPLKNLPTAAVPRLSSETQLFFERCPGKIIGITGTKGKSTTSSLIYTALKTAGMKTILLGNIGKPSLDYLDELDQDTWVVFELSSHQLQTLNKSPHIAVFLNFYPEHLDYYESLANYFNAKANITLHQTDQDYLLFNENFEKIKTLTDLTKAKLIPFRQPGSKESNVLLKNTKLLGHINAMNVLAAKKVSEIVGVHKSDFAKAARNFAPLEHRLEFVGEYKGIRFINDSLATIPEATIGALDALGEDVETIIIGGLDRGVKYSALSKKIVQSRAKNLILFPTTGEKIWEEIKRLNPKANKNYVTYETSEMKKAVKFSYRYTSPGKIALLSPASTSFNLFKNYADRGNQFKEWVVKLGKS